MGIQAISLKNQNVVPIGGIVGICVIIAWCITYGIEGLTDYKGYINELGGGAFLLVVSTWIANMLPAELKHKLIFIRIRNALPGHRFIKLIRKDPRIDLSLVASKLGLREGQKIGPKDQNKLWYTKLYKPVQDNKVVAGSHKSFLLYRDAGVSVILMTVAIAVGLIFFSISPLFVFVLFIESLLLMITANTLGKRFVTTTVAVAMS